MIAEEHAMHFARDAVVNPQSARTGPKPIADSKMASRTALPEICTEGDVEALLAAIDGGRKGVVLWLRRGAFGGEVTNYSVQNFEGVSIFCVDVELCLKKLTPLWS